MAKVWVVNSSSGPRTIGGELLASGEGAWVDDGTEPAPTEAVLLTSAERLLLRNLLEWAGKGQFGYAGMVAVNNGQLIARSLVRGPGIEILHPDGIDGDPTFIGVPSIVQLGWASGVNLNSTADQAIPIYEYPQYIVTHVLATNASTTPTSAAGGVYSTTGKGGRVLVPSSQVYTGMTDSTAVVPLAVNTPWRRLTGPNLYLSLTTATGTACTADIYVFGCWLKG